VRTLVATLVLAALAASDGGARSPDDEGGSLEAFLKRVRAEREAERARLAPRVDELVKKLGLARGPSELKKLHAEIEALGSEAVPLLVPFLDPGPSPKPEQEKQAREVAELLVRARHPALLEELVALARSASPLGRLLAVRVLGAAPDVERALASLRALYPEVSGALRAEAVRALAHLAPGDPLVVAALGDTHPEVLSAALLALAPEAAKGVRPEVRALLSDASRGADVLPELVAYLAAPGRELDEDMVAELLRFACRSDLDVESRLAVLSGLPRFGVPLTSRLRREAEPLLASPDAAIKDGALVALTLLKDGRARRDLMRFYDEQVEQNPNWPLAYQRRGDIQLAIAEYRDAARDYERALELHGDNQRLPGNRDLWVNLARAHVKDGKLKAAADVLEEFSLTSELRRQLAADPDFQPLVEHAKYKSLFE
jgi:tetratricopeptide (TPR) repeat protein